MGIPVYFKTLINEYQGDILITEKINNIEALFLDLNCLIHPCCRGETDEDIMIQKIINGITILIEYSQVQRLVYIAIDGVAPKGKMKQQRMRRYKSILEKVGQWDTNAISPGTFFMNKLNHQLKQYQYKDLHIILNDSNQRGEGEHKILHFIKNNTLDRCAIYGLDADLIMLSMVSQKNDIYLLRERTEYNIEKTDSEYIYLNIDQLKDKIKILFNIYTENIIDDYIFICFFLGNDFINHIPSINLRYKGLDLLIDTYKELQKEYDGYFYLIDRSLPNLICFTFLKEYLSKLTTKEPFHIKKMIEHRKYQYTKIENQFHREYIHLNQFMKDKKLSIQNIHLFLQNKEENYKEMINHLPLLMKNNEEIKFQDLTHLKDKNNLSKDFFESLLWTTHYYFNQCIDWKWCSKYNSVPLIKDLSNYLSKEDIMIKKNDISFTIEEQLNYILPHQSNRVHKYKIKKKDYELILDISFKRYLWECDIEFI